MKTSVVVSAYRRPDLVPAVLSRIARQLVRPDEVFYAEDGRDPAMAAALRTTAERLQLPVRHIRQPNPGPRKPTAVNRAVRHTTGDRLLFLDQDCLPNRFWLACHRLLGRPGVVLQGWRVHVRPRGVPAFLSHPFPVAHALTRGELYPRHRLLPSCSTPPAELERYEVLGCNLSLERSTFLAVGGYDEFYCGWGYEDTDLVIRLRNQGHRYRVAGGPIVVFHLDHPLQPRVGVESRKDACRQRREAGTVRPVSGLRAEPLAPAAPGASACYTAFDYAD